MRALFHSYHLCFAVGEQKIFESAQERVNTAGVYRLKLCKNGVWQEVTVDDNFPCDASGSLLYAYSNQNELWVSVIMVSDLSPPSFLHLLLLPFGAGASTRESFCKGI